ncbi:Hemerythrin HHE cation binding domain-containing protein [Georgenia satyanarayanai]|uniref:Hemerythrin HHE cation binding domain-containing protein n=1 Tax=Georgenia satyanarayanai TaxID=860221 RepID=A0A2Y9AS43_9MICO|nr:hemerythrin domain-containing protein [Georgenia satyanarayanai]PYF95950.1 hemerythrin HHE cation binding domain-containing protein [Georgenia satyanarayanai]SSA47271.1 Hemerythrin HHE cation binding domain-containing protein [Georgenia satyanarayanai]
MSQTPGTAEQDVVDFLTNDHALMVALLETIQETADLKERRDLADTLIAEVMRHAVAEEMHVYPAVEKHVPNGKEEVEHDKKEHDELVDVMKRIEDLDSEDPRFLQEIREMHGMLKHHANDEETDQFPKLRQHIPREELVELREKVETAMRAAPTRPHPSAPHSELFHKTLGPGVGFIDRLRDKLSGRTTDA